MTSWLAIALLGGLVGLDATGFPQLMFSRPIIAGLLAGLAFGLPLEGMLVGGALEISALVILPVGAARYPEAGIGAVAAAAAVTAAHAHGPYPVLLLLAIVLGLVWERVAGLSVVLLRRQNERLVAGDRRQPPSARSVERRHLTALSLDMLRGVIMSLVGAVMGAALLRALAPLWLPGPAVAAGLLTVALTGLVAACLPLMGGFRERRLVFVAGLICGVALLLLT